MSHPYSRRLQKEFKALTTSKLDGVALLESSTLTDYTFSVSVSNALYSQQQFLLSVVVDKQYPVGPPQVKFVTIDEYTVPVHPHIYSNGHICLNVLGTDWTPACGIETVVLSVQSMLSTNSLLERPPDDDPYVSRAPKDPRKGQFLYHDDAV